MLAVCAAALPWPVLAQSEEWPARPVTVIVPFAPAGVADIVARPIAEALTRILRQPFVITNRPGAAGATGNAAVAAAKPDGYTLLAALASITAIPEAERIGGKPPTYRMDQFTPVARITSDPSVMIVRAESPWKTAQELIADARGRPGKIPYSSSGIYGNIHIAVEMLAHAASLEFIHVPYPGGGPANAALLSSAVEFTLSGVSSSIGFIRGGKARPLGVFGAQRLEAMPDLPTMKELGYDVEYYTWCGLFGPAGLPANVMTRLREGVRQAVADPQVKNAFAKMETPIEWQDAPEFAKFVADDARKLAAVINRIGRLEQTK